jgi:signal transduction histidine kinase
VGVLPRLQAIQQASGKASLADVMVLAGVVGDTQYLYYEASDLLKKVRIYPYLLLALVLLFLLLAYLAFSFSRNAEQNQLWVGMAKETAHQLGTPLSSMSAWMDILEDKLTDEDGVMIRNELIKDISRLEIVAERFSKIGSSPTLEKVHAAEILQKCVDYISKRASVKVEFYITDITQGNDICMISPPLFEWVIENLLKNALDAMDGVGTIGILAMRKDQQLIIEVHDTGKGIPKNKFNAVFEPGFTTKKRGWGLGLTLTRRIIEHYHQGKIFVKDSVPGKGTTFRIELKAGS